MAASGQAGYEPFESIDKYLKNNNYLKHNKYTAAVPSL
jgi:hypothetical protein